MFINIICLQFIIQILIEMGGGSSKQEVKKKQDVDPDAFDNYTGKNPQINSTQGSPVKGPNMRG